MRLVKRTHHRFEQATGTTRGPAAVGNTRVAHCFRADAVPLGWSGRLESNVDCSHATLTDQSNGVESLRADGRVVVTSSLPGSDAHLGKRTIIGREAYFILVLLLGAGTRPGIPAGVGPAGGTAAATDRGVRSQRTSPVSEDPPLARPTCGEPWP